MTRLFLAALWALTLGLVVAAGLLFRQLADSPPLIATEPGSWTQGASVRTARGTPGTTWGAWRVVGHLSAHHVAVIDVETDRPRDARRIALTLTEPLKANYAEIIIYFHRPGPRTGLPARRVQWSPSTGYVETDYDADATPGSAPAGR